MSYFSKQHIGTGFIYKTRVRESYTMPTARKQVRSGSEASINATQLHRPNCTLSLSFEILERIGMKIDSLAAVGIWNSVLATRHRGLMRLVDGLPHLTYANVEPMIHIDVIHGT